MRTSTRSRERICCRQESGSPLGAVLFGRRRVAVRVKRAYRRRRLHRARRPRAALHVGRTQVYKCHFVKGGGGRLLKGLGRANWYNTRRSISVHSPACASSRGRGKMWAHERRALAIEPEHERHFYSGFHHVSDADFIVILAPGMYEKKNQKCITCHHSTRIFTDRVSGFSEIVACFLENVLLGTWPHLWYEMYSKSPDRWENLSEPM